MKIKPSTLILGVLLLCVVAGWLVERRSLQQQHEGELQRATDASASFSAAAHVNSIYSGLDLESPAKSEERRLTHLLTVIYYLYKNEPNEGANQQGLSLSLAKASLDLLGCSNTKQLRTLVANDSSYYGFAEPFIDPKDQEYDQLEEFVSRATQWTPESH